MGCENILIGRNTSLFNFWTQVNDNYTKKLNGIPFNYLEKKLIDLDFIFIKLITDSCEIERYIKIKSDIKHGSQI